MNVDEVMRWMPAVWFVVAFLSGFSIDWNYPDKWQKLGITLAAYAMIPLTIVAFHIPWKP